MLDAQLIHAVHATRGSGAVFQTSTLEALLHGAYAGDVTVAELAGRGDLGLGTFDALDGELIAVDGVVFRAAEDGTVAPAEPGRRCPFAVVTRFIPRLEAHVGALGFDALLARLDRDVPRAGICSAIRLDGRFAHVRLRSVPAQAPPWRPLDEVLRDQRVMDAHDVAGAVVGFRFLPNAAGLDVPGFHLHFISADRRFGGHLLSCRTADVVARLDPDADLDLELPPGVELPADGAGLGTLERLERDALPGQER
jgi:acetolactate decarboxylase